MRPVANAHAPGAGRIDRGPRIRSSQVDASDPLRFVPPSPCRNLLLLSKVACPALDPAPWQLPSA